MEISFVTELAKRENRFLTLKTLIIIERRIYSVAVQSGNMPFLNLCSGIQILAQRDLGAYISKWSQVLLWRDPILELFTPLMYLWLGFLRFVLCVRASVDAKVGALSNDRDNLYNHVM